jgi:hypothetical protein
MTVDTWKPEVFLGAGIPGLNSGSISTKPFWRNYIAQAR